MLAAQFLGWLGLTLALAWALRDTKEPAAGAKIGGRWWLLVACAIVGFRWPLLWTLHEFNHDEGQLIAGALTLRHDPVFWRSVDGHTAGPLVFYPLLPTAWLHGLAAFAVARLIGLAATIGTLFFAGELIARFAPPLAARVAVLPAAAFVAFTTSADLLFYSTESATVLLLAAALYLVGRHTAQPSRLKLAVIGTLLGAAPWAKMQAVPLVVAIGLLLAWGEIAARRPRSVGWLLGFGALPSVALLGVALATGQLEHWAVPFALNHFTFLGVAAWTLGQVCVRLSRAAVTDGYLALWLAGGIAFALLTWPLVRSAGPPRLRRLTLIAGGLVLAALVCMLTPRRPFTHYFHWLEVPFILVTGGTLALGLGRRPWQRGRALALGSLFLLCTVAPQLGWRLLGTDASRAFNTGGVEPEERLLVYVVRFYTTPGESLAIWGWRSSLYVEGGLRQATRQGQSEEQLRPSRWQPYFLQRYYDDITQSRPPLFVDAVGPSNFVFKDRRQAHESFPALRAWIETGYTLVLDTRGTRVYVRNDRLAARGMWNGMVPPPANAEARTGTPARSPARPGLAPAAFRAQNQFGSRAASRVRCARHHARRPGPRSPAVPSRPGGAALDRASRLASAPTARPATAGQQPGNRRIRLLVRPAGKVRLPASPHRRHGAACVLRGLGRRPPVAPGLDAPRSGARLCQRVVDQGGRI